MQVTSGTTSAWIHVVGRWAFAGSVLVGAGMGFAGYRPWACLTVFWLLCWAVWMFAALIRRQRHIPGNIVHIPLLGVAFLFACHLAWFMIFRGQRSVSTMEGQLDASLLFHMILLALGVFLAQSYLGDGDHTFLLRLCGGVMVLGSLAALIFPRSPGAGDAHAITLLTGLFVFAAPRWTNRPRRVFWSSSARASIFMLAGVCVLVMFGLTILWWNTAGGLGWQTPQGWFGLGELAFSTVSGASSGSAVLGGTTGFVGWLLFVAGLLVALVRVLIRGQWSRTSFFWIAATALATLGVLSPGGYFLPLTSVAFALTWGLLPRLCGVPTKKASGLFVVITTLLLATLLGVTRKPGLLLTISNMFDLSDKQAHGIFGFLLAIVLAWWFGAKRTWMGAIGIVVAGLLGGLGEVAQRLAGMGRAYDLLDWRAHAIGSGVAAVLLCLCFVARYGVAGHRRQIVMKAKQIPAMITGWALLLVALVASAGWVGLSIWRVAELWNRPKTWFAVSDGIYAVGRNAYYLRGVIEPEPPPKSNLLMTVSGNGILDAYLSKTNILARLLGQEAGLHRQAVLGQPFGELSSQRQQKCMMVLIEKGSKVFAVDVSMVMSPRTKQPNGADAALAELRKQGAVVFFDTGQPMDYWKYRPLLQVRFPDTPCVACMPAARNSTDVLTYIQAASGSRLVILTSDINLARAATGRLGRTAEVHLIDPDAKPTPMDKNITFAPDLRALTHPAASTNPAKR